MEYSDASAAEDSATQHMENLLPRPKPSTIFSDDDAILSPDSNEHSRPLTWS